MMKPLVRSIIFWSFITFFFVTAPLSVLYTAGFRYNFQNGSLVRTGVISISTVPRNTQISLNGESIGESTPYVIKRLMPETYSLTLEKDGYHAWSGTVEVKSGATTLLQSILLFRNEEPELIINQSITSIAEDGANHVAYIVKEAGWVEIWLHNLKNNDKQLLERIPAKLLTSTTDLSFSASGGYLLAQNLTNNYASVFDALGSKMELKQSLINSSDLLFWHPSADHLLYATTDKQLHQIDLITGSEKIFNDPGAGTVILDATVITFFDNGSKVELRQSFDGENKLIALLPRSTYKIAKRDNEYLILQDLRGQVLVINIRADQPILFEKQVEIFDWLDDQDILVYSDGIEINVYDAKSHHTEFITRQSGAISNITWYTSQDAIIYSTADQIKTIEHFQIAKQRKSTPLLEGADIKLFWINKSGKTLYFFGEYQGVTGLFSQRIAR